MHPGNSSSFIISPVLVGVLCTALGIPLALDKVKPNNLSVLVVEGYVESLRA
jgi:hypothetical protein